MNQCFARNGFCSAEEETTKICEIKPLSLYVER